MAGAVNTIGQSKRGGGDRSSRPAQLQARENEQKALSLWIKGATYQQIAAAGFGIASASGAWRAVRRALARIPKQEADQAREAQLVRLQAVRMLLWNQASADPIRAAEALIKLEAREARLLGLDMPTKVAVKILFMQHARGQMSTDAVALTIILLLAVTCFLAGVHFDRSLKPARTRAT
jgi:hypothetical protein